MNREILNSAKSVISQRKALAEAKAQAALNILMGYDDYRLLDEQIRMQTLIAARAEYSKSKDLTLEKEKLTALELEKDELTLSHGFSKKDLTPDYACKKCNDSGYVDGQICKCLQFEITKQLVKNSQCADASHTFENNSDSKNTKIFDYAKRYCEKFPDIKKSNLLLFGKTGVGKTFLCDCIANKIMNRGFKVVSITAYQLSRQFLLEHTASTADKDSYSDSLIMADLLIIDDLGSEPKLKNVTEEYLFSLLNERNRNHSATIISTNLDLASIQNKYGDRVFTRLSDKEITTIYEFTGSDKRILSK